MSLPAVTCRLQQSVERLTLGRQAVDEIGSQNGCWRVSEAGPPLALETLVTFGRATAQTTAPIAPLAEALADALERQGDIDAAKEVLSIAAVRTADSGLAMRRSEAALARGDAARALHALVPAWEAGSQEPRLEARLALCALALGLYDVARQLCESSKGGVEHAGIRLLLAFTLGEGVHFETTKSWSELMFCVRTQLRQLACCGRTDVVWATQQRVCDLGVPGFGRVVSGLRATPPPARAPSRPPMGGRAAFREAWQWPGADAVYGFAWSAARDVLSDERVLLLGPQPAPLQPLFAHGQVTSIASHNAEAVDMLATPEALPVAPTRFAHAVAILWLRDAYDPRLAVDELAVTLAHDGYLNLACVGPSAPGDHDLRLSLRATVRACAAAGLEVVGTDSRAADGTHGDHIHLVRARRRLV